MKPPSGKGAALWRQQSAVILLEVVLALALFVAAAAIFTATLNSSMAALERQSISLRAESLASSLLAEIQMGARPFMESGELELDPALEGWSAEVVTEPAQHEMGDVTQLTLLEIVVRHTNSTIVRRLAQTIDPATLSASPALDQEEGATP